MALILRRAQPPDLCGYAWAAGAVPLTCLGDYFQAALQSHAWMGAYRIGSGWTALDCVGVDWIDLGWVGLAWVGWNGMGWVQVSGVT